MNAEERTRVDFNAPVSLVEQADIVADLLDVSRTQLVIEALRGELEDLASDESFQRRIRDAYYAGDLDFETVESLLGTEESMRLKLLRDSVDRGPPEPQIDTDLPAAEFYEGAVPEWTSPERDERDSR